jgi:hypothetical protein
MLMTSTGPKDLEIAGQESMAYFLLIMDVLLHLSRNLIISQVA